MKWLLLIALLTSRACFPQQTEVYFDFDKSELNTAALQKLDSFLTANADIEITKIYGYCDWKGSSAYNDTLSLQRVRSVFAYLKKKNVFILPDYQQKGFGKDFEQSDIQAENRKVIVSYRKKAIPEASESVLTQTINASKTGDVIKLPNLYFFNNSARIVPKSAQTLQDLLCALQDNPNLKIAIEGHICCQKERDEFDISTARAKAVYLFLIRNKIARGRLDYKGFGISRPVHPIPEKNAAEEDDNRRVEIRIVGK